ncbi:MAG: GNAT family N-acetyltransferase [Anaerolineales bacterium]|nr:GNAT family N-acetyltransferase [Anaerolineales bacterium]
MRLLDPEGLQAVAAIQEQVWGEPLSPDDMQRLAKRIGESRDAFFVYLAYVGGQPAATAHLTIHSPTTWAGLGGAATLPAYRRRGLYRSLLMRRLRDAQQAGVRLLEAEASPMSQPALQAVGFVHTTDCRLYDSPAPAS